VPIYSAQRRFFIQPMSEEEEALAVNRVCALISAGCTVCKFCEALSAETLDWRPPGEAADGSSVALLDLLTAAVKGLGAREFVDRTTKLLQSLPGASESIAVRVKPRNKKRVAIYSGAFDPITNSHLTCVAEIVHSGCADEVWLVPQGERPHDTSKQCPRARPIDRYVMCQIAVNTVYAPDFPVKVRDDECFTKELLRSYDLLCSFRAQHPEIDFVFIVGSDRILSDIRTWTSVNRTWRVGDSEEHKFVITGSKLLEEFDVLVIRRPGFEVPTGLDDATGLQRFGPRVAWMQMPEGITFVEVSLSSEEVKRRGEFSSDVWGRTLHNIDGLVPRGVLAYIWRHDLYGMRSPPQAMNGAPTAERKQVAIYGGAFDPVTNSHLTGVAEIVHSGCADEVWLVPCGPRPDKPNLKTSPMDRFCMCRIAVNSCFTSDLPVTVSDIECFADSSFYTYDLLCSLRIRHPEADFSFIIGSDWLQPGSNLASWTSANWNWKPGDPEEEKVIVTGARMLEEFRFLIIRRPGYDVPTTAEDPTGLLRFGKNLSWLRMKDGQTLVEGNLSSTEVRRRTALARRRCANSPRKQGNHGGLEEKSVNHSRNYFGLDGLVPAAVIAYMGRRGLYAY